MVCLIGLAWIIGFGACQQTRAEEESIPNETCLDCHSDEELTYRIPPERLGPTIAAAASAPERARRQQAARRDYCEREQRAGTAEHGSEHHFAPLTRRLRPRSRNSRL